MLSDHQNDSENKVLAFFTTKIMSLCTDSYRRNLPVPYPQRFSKYTY